MNRHPFSQKICGDLVVNALPQRINGADRPNYHLLSFHELMDHLLRWGNAAFFPDGTPGRKVGIGKRGGKSERANMRCRVWNIGPVRNGIDPGD